MTIEEKVSLYLEEKINKEIENIDDLEYKKLIDPLDQKNKSVFIKFFNNPKNKDRIKMYFEFIVNQYDLVDVAINNDILEYLKTNERYLLDKKEKEIIKWKYDLVILAFLKMCYEFKEGVFAKEIIKGEFGDYDQYYKNIKNRTKVEYLTLQKFKELIENQSSNTFYRGQTNACWNISPSMLRELNKNIFIDFDSFRWLSQPFYDRYDCCFDKRRDSWAYNKVAFAQHAISYSPLIDFSKNIIISTSFALSNRSSINSYKNNNAALFEWKILPNTDYLDENLKIRANSFMRDNGIINLNRDSFCPGETYIAKKIIYDKKGNVKEEDINASFKTFDEIGIRLIPNFIIYDIQSNDRMKYQKGVFLYFYGKYTVSFNGRIYYEFNPYLLLTKYEIKYEDKDEILKYIEDNYRQYDPSHLMNPYAFVGE